MMINETCFDCLSGRIEYECRLVLKEDTPENNEKIAGIIESCRNEMKKCMAEKLPSTLISSRIHRNACRQIGDTDPYKEIKQRTNREALAVLENVEGMLADFRSCVLAAVIGNTLDFGGKEHIVTDDFSVYFREEFKKGLYIDDTDEILRHSSRVVYLCDNAGEIVFDRKVIECLKAHGAHVTVVIKGAPIINDACMEDALFAGIDKTADKILESTDGVSEVGINLDLISDELRDEINNASVIISKGMANYEALSEYKKTVPLPPVAYLLMIKCPSIAEDIGIPKGERAARLVI